MDNWDMFGSIGKRPNVNYGNRMAMQLDFWTYYIQKVKFILD